MTATRLMKTPATIAAPALRGRLVVAERVVEKIAGQAATEAGASSGRGGRLLGADPAARPRVEVDLSRESADLALKVGIAYPAPIRAATERVRQHVSQRVQWLTGIDVRRVDIDVTMLVSERDVPQVLR